MNDYKSLVESRAFWSALLALVAVVANALHLSRLAAAAADPDAVERIMQGMAMLGAVGAIVFRFTATKQIASVLPPGGGPGAGKALVAMMAAPVVAMLAGCAAVATPALGGVAGIAMRIGADAVAFDCAGAELIRVIAADAAAAARVQAALDANARFARAACPGLKGAPTMAVAGG